MYKNEIFNWTKRSKDMDSCLLLEVWVINMEKKLVDKAKKSATDAIKTASKTAI